MIRALSILPRGARIADACVAELDSVFARRTLAQWKELLAKLDAPWAPVQSVHEVIEDPQVTANGYVGRGQARRRPEPIGCRRCRCSSMNRHRQLRRAPEHGEHTEALLQELGYDWDAISKMMQDGVIP